MQNGARAEMALHRRLSECSQKTKLHSRGAIYAKLPPMTRTNCSGEGLASVLSEAVAKSPLCTNVLEAWATEKRKGQFPTPAEIQLEQASCTDTLAGPGSIVTHGADLA